MNSRFDNLSPRAQWFVENFDFFGLAELCANNEAAAQRTAVTIARVQNLRDKWAKRTDQLKRGSELLAAALAGRAPEETDATVALDGVFGAPCAKTEPHAPHRGFAPGPVCPGREAEPEICELPHQTIAEEDECDRQRLAAAPMTAAEEDDAGRTYENLRRADLDDLGLTAADIDRLTAQGIPVQVVGGAPAAHAAAVAQAVNSSQQAAICPHGADTSRCPCLACEAEQPDETGTATAAAYDEQADHSYRDMVNAPLPPATVAALRKRLAAGDLPTVKVSERHGTAPAATDTAGLREQYAAAVQRCVEEGNVRYAHIADRVLAVRDHAMDDLRSRLASAEQVIDFLDGEERRRIAAEKQRDQYAATLDEVLRHFVHKGHPGEPCLQTGWISEKTVAKWRAIAYPPAPAPASDSEPSVRGAAE